MLLQDNPDEVFAKSLFKKIPEGLMVGYFAVDMPFYFMNDSMLEYLGYNDQQEFAKAVYGSCSNIIHSEDRERVLSEITSQYLRGDSIYKSTYRARKKDGSYISIMSKSVYFKANDNMELLLSICVDVSDREVLIDRIERGELLLKAAVSNTHTGVWEYKHKDKQLVRINCAPRFDFLPEIMENVPECLMDTFIEKSSEQGFIQMFKDIERGKNRATCELKLYFPDTDEHAWERIIVSVINNDNGEPVSGIFISEDITAEKEAELKYQQEMQLRNTVSLGLIAASRSNLSKNKVEFLQSDTNKLESLDIDRYDQLRQRETAYIANKEDLERYNNTLDRATLIKAFEAGRLNINLDYRRKFSGGRIAWVNLSVRLSKDIISGDIYAHSSMRDINEQKNIELSLIRRAERDTLTGAYNHETALNMINDAVQVSKKDGNESAIVLFNVDNFSSIVHKDGYQAGDTIIGELYSMISAEFSEPKIIGRLFGDEIVLWLGASPDKDVVYNKAEKIRHILNIGADVSHLKSEISVSVGMAFSKLTGVDSKYLVEQAQEALMACREIGGNCCVVKDENLNVISDSRNIMRQYSKKDIGEIVMRCMFSLTSINNINKAIKAILKDLSLYYGTECACMIELDITDGKLRSTYKHTETELKCCIKDDMALLERVQTILGNKSRMVIDNVQNCAEETSKDAIDKLVSVGVHGAYSVTLRTNDDKIVGYLSVSSPTMNKGDTVLIDLLACILASNIEKRQSKEKYEYSKSHDELTGVLNRNSYLKFVNCFESDTIISLGVAVIDINGLKQINVSYGYKTGDQLVVFIAEMLSSVPNAKVFRLSGDEFILICENVTQEAFQKHIVNVRGAIDKEYPDSVAMGYVWSDTDITDPNTLLMQADEKMVIAKQAYYKESLKLAKNYDPYAEQILIEDIKNGHYEMYLQPKAIVADGSISGAEALVRYHNVKGELIPPVQFIPQLEASGNIYHIDMFIFEEVCRTLKRWQTSGKKLIPISLNFSRITLLRESLLEDMEEIYERYDIPKNFLEIEVTESVGSVERQTLIDISASIVRNGYILSLDDFGSKYSNLSILSAMQLHVLKLDKSLVNDLLSNNNTRTVMKNFLITCRDLGIISVAEGVETREQLEILKELGCDYAQGYYFNKPMPYGEFERLYM